MISDDERIDIRSSLIVLGKLVEGLADQQAESTKANTKLTAMIANVLMEMKERDIRDEYLKLEIKEIKERQIEKLALYEPIALRVKADHLKQDKRRALYESDSIRILVKLVAGVLGVGIIVVVAMLLGLPISALNIG